MKKDNKGFSLIELIIVIAIMAVLVVVLAPQFTKYIERGRKSTDVQSVAEIVTALEVYAADPMVAAADKITTGAKVTITTTETAVTTGNATNNADKALKDAGITAIGLSSSGWTTSGTVVLEVTIDTNGTVTVADASTGKTADHEILDGKYK